MGESIMFTGLIETVGTLQSFSSKNDYKVMQIHSDFSHTELELGESIACDGACLTVISFDKNSFTVEVSKETSERTIISQYKTGQQINLERAMKLGGRMGGHMVSGHIDCRGQIKSISPVGNSLEIYIAYDSNFDNLIIEKGSIAVNGVSLTINKVSSGNLSVNIIPHTEQKTTLSKLKQNDFVNLEFDMIGKYIAKAMHKNEKKSLTIDKLIESGW